MALPLLGLPSMSFAASFSQQLIFGCHLTDVPVDVLGFIKESGFDTHQTPPALFMSGVQSLCVGFGVETSVHYGELPGLHISSLHVFLWPAQYIGRVPNDWQVIGLDGGDLVLVVELGLQTYFLVYLEVADFFAFSCFHITVGEQDTCSCSVCLHMTCW